MSEHGQNFIAGSWQNGHTNVENINPSDIGDVIGHYAKADLAQLNIVLDAARSAQRKWTTNCLEARQTTLMSIGNELIERGVELGTLLSREEGKPLAEGVGEIFRAGQFFTYYAAEVLRQIGDTADIVRDGVEIDIRREPVGVVAINLPTAGTDYHVPFGGLSNSSYGPREQGGYAEEFYTVVKTSYIAAGNPE